MNQEDPRTTELILGQKVVYILILDSLIPSIVYGGKCTVVATLLLAAPCNWTSDVVRTIGLCFFLLGKNERC